MTPYDPLLQQPRRGNGPTSVEATGPLTTVTLRSAPSAVLVFLNTGSGGLQQRQVPSAPGAGQFSLAGNVVTITAGPGDIVTVYAWA